MGVDWIGWNAASRGDMGDIAKQVLADHERPIIELVICMLNTERCM